jgi:hypothetical protein
MGFYQIPASTKKTGASVSGVEITGDPSTSCNVVGSFKGSDEDPGDGTGWFAGPGQDPSCANVVLNFSVPLHAFGVSFMHFSGAGIIATNPVAYVWHRANHRWTWLWRFHSCGRVLPPFNDATRKERLPQLTLPPFSDGCELEVGRF